jgi:predicted RNA binding protein YcfA (HicA-like mRNA interferase family)
VPNLLAISAKKAIKALETPDSRVYRQTGSQIHFWNGERKLVVAVPKHPEMAKAH